MTDTPKSDTPKANRPRRFALPAHDDHRAVEAIDALLGAPSASNPDALVAERGRGRAGSKGAFGGLDSRLAFMEATRREEERVRRYRRPASVAVLAVESVSRNGTGARDVERGTWWLIDATTRVVRETDRVARVGPGRIHLLLPETRPRQAERVVDRIRERWNEQLAAQGDRATVLLSVGIAAVPARGGAAEAFDRAESLVGAGERT